MKFVDNLESDRGLKRKSLKVAHDELLDKALYGRRETIRVGACQDKTVAMCTLETAQKVH